jgi:quercetin dioxygenase-like cupin family protein
MKAPTTYAARPDAKPVLGEPGAAGPAATVASPLGFRGRFLPSDDPDVLIGETWVSPGGGAGPLHRHLHQEERFEVHEGAITVRLGRTRHVLKAGDTFTVPPGAPHTFVNHTGAEAHIRTYFTPPMRLEQLFGELAAIGGKPSLGQAGRLMADYRDEFFYLAYVPVALQRAVGALARRFIR